MGGVVMAIGGGEFVANWWGSYDLDERLLI